MSYAHIAIDGRTILDEDLSGSQHAPIPSELAKYLTPQTQQQPGMMALLLALATAVKSGQDFTANLRNRAGGYDLSVDYGRASTPAMPVLNGRVDSVAREVGATHWPVKR